MAYLNANYKLIRRAIKEYAVFGTDY